MPAPWDGRLITYLGNGLAADRPATPNIAPGITALWYSTDTTDLSIWAGGAWVSPVVATLANGGTGASLTDPGADRIMFWDDSASTIAWLSLSSALAITGTVLGLAATAGTLNFDTDPTLAANSDALIATQKAVKSYVDNAVVGLIDYKGATDCSTNPNYPAALKGDAYVVSVAGKIGGASGEVVNVGDFFFAKEDNAGGTQASVGSSWDILEYNANVPTEASAADIWAGSATNKFISPDKLFDASAFQTLTDGATVTPDFNNGLNWTLTIGGNRTLANPTNAKDGQSGVIKVIQDGTGGRTLAYGSNWKFPGTAAVGGVLSTSPGMVDAISYVVTSDGTILATLSKDFSS